MIGKNSAEVAGTFLQSISITAIHDPYKGGARVKIRPDHHREVRYATTPTSDVPSNHFEWFTTRGLNIDGFDISPNAWDCGYYFPEFQ